MGFNIYDAFLIYTSLITTCNRKDVSISNGCHCYDHPVKCRRNWRESRVLPQLDEVCKTGKDEATDANEENEKTQFFVAILESIRNSLKT